jgi:hypothetical protein
MIVKFFGDVFLGGDLFEKSLENLLGPELLCDDKFNIVNLEHPIGDSEFFSDKSTLFSSSKALNQLEELGVNAVGLANNHIHDKGNEGILETCSLLEKSKIKYFGAGSNSIVASKNLELDKSIVVMGFCDFDKSYLRKVQLAKHNKPGVNGLSKKNIIAQLNKLSKDQEAILYLHWGVEHVWLPRYSDITLVNELLNHPKVGLIVGSHAHRFQGSIKLNGKSAYFCLGNYIFPNFFYDSPAMLKNTINCDRKYNVTYQYHTVDGLTYKKWPLVNRVSIAVEYNALTGEVSHEFLFQNESGNRIYKLTRLESYFFASWFWLLGLVYRLPKYVYTPLSIGLEKITYWVWNTKIYIFRFKQLSLKQFAARVRLKYFE